MPEQSSAFRYALVAALGGLLFGFDTAVISGVEGSIQHLWSLDKFAMVSPLLQRSSAR